MEYGYEAFKADIYKMTNINLSLYKERQMKRRIESLMTRKGFSGYREYVAAMRQDDELLRTFVSYLTINVSEFYRNPKQWEVFEQEMIPLLKARKDAMLHIWSAACSTGDEPYTIAMIMLRHFAPEQFRIYATDIDADVLRYAKEGFYLNRSLERLPQDMKQQYFVQEDKGYRIAEKVKKCVEFRKHNLLEDRYPSGMHMIVCRNVVIYFTEEAKDEVYSNFHKSLVKDGILFVGSTEQIIHAKEIGFEATDSFFYRRI